MAAKAQKADSLDPELKELREEFTYAQSEKREIKAEGAEDMRAIAGDVWDPKERKEREDINRPCLSLDELGQYVNQLINDVRENKRSIKVAPKGRGATKETAEFRQNLIREIEYESNAQQAYSVMFENSSQRSYGYLRIKPEYASHRSDDQELRIVSIPNPDMVVEDPSAQRTDGGDWKFLYFGEQWTHAAFKRKFGAKATISDFGMAMRSPGVSEWVKASTVIVAERWRIVTKPTKLLLIQPPPVLAMPGQPPPPAPVPLKLLEGVDDIPRGSTVLRTLRTVDYPTVKKQITNGIEILEDEDFPGTSIPFVSCYGKVLYLDDGSGPKKKILSLIRLARDPLMLYCFYRTQQAEMAGMIPKVPVQGYRGQFTNNASDWQRAPHEPLAWIEAEFTVEGWQPQWGPMPLPQRLAYSAGEHLQALELCAEGARRAIQSAIGASPLPTQAQRRNEKSGIALQKMDESAQKGSFHFVDHFDDALIRTGQILEDLIPHYYDAPRDVTVRQPDDQPAVIRINDPEHPQNVPTDGDHDVTISVGPRQESEREAASDFADTIIGSPLIQMMPPPMALKIIALAVRLKAVGPVGDEIADTISPPEKEGAQQGPTPEQAAQMQAQIQELTAKLQEAAQTIEADKVKAQATLDKAHIDADSREKIAAAQLEAKRAENETKLAVAELGAKIERLALFLEERARLGVQAQQAGEAALGRQHEVGMAGLSAEQQAQAAAQGGV